MLRLLHVEWLKLRRSVVWLLAVMSPLLAGVAGYASVRIDGVEDWQRLFTVMSLLHALLFLPLLTGIYAAFLCRYEHTGGGWKLMLSLPVRRTQVYAVKLTVIMLLLAVTQLLFLLAVVLVGLTMGFPDALPWRELLHSGARGYAACLSLAALQLFVSVFFQSFAAPLAVNVIFTLPNLLVANSSTYGPYYPWAQPLLAMIPKDSSDAGIAFLIPMQTLFMVVGLSFLGFFAAGWMYFRRKAV